MKKDFALYYPFSNLTKPVAVLREQCFYSLMHDAVTMILTAKSQILLIA